MLLLGLSPVNNYKYKEVWGSIWFLFFDDITLVNVTTKGKKINIYFTIESSDNQWPMGQIQATKPPNMAHIPK